MCVIKIASQQLVNYAVMFLKRIKTETAVCPNIRKPKRKRNQDFTQIPTSRYSDAMQFHFNWNKNTLCLKKTLHKMRSYIL